MINFLHHFQPNSILFQFGFLKIHWYGLFIVLGIIAGLLVVLKLAKNQKISRDQIYDFGFYLLLASLLGARIYAVFLDLRFYQSHPFEIFAVWHGGLAIHGAIIGAVFTLVIYCWTKGLNFWILADLLVVALPLGQAIGRFGNYFNQELFGRPTDLSWGIPIDLANRPLEYLSHHYFHPTFLYESILNLLNFLILLFIYQKLKLKSGVLLFIYLINYSIIRILMEILRLDQTPLFFGVRWPIVFSTGLIIVSLVMIFVRFKGLTLRRH
ncbi:MAG: prolipoprotein diacylglyceryl transferase [Patescibacteria group bacterium]|jgi:phosphatidylglycerol:prolipoprotein diacylglycerol transferase|nr:prolipoprotein diacylglyceryl transferase [Patescibacteria group bacterium]